MQDFLKIVQMRWDVPLASQDGSRSQQKMSGRHIEGINKAVG